MNWADRWKCSECGGVYNGASLLRAASPFDKDDTIVGCPRCKSVDSMTGVCDEPRCDSVSTCGFPTEGGYRRTCGDHYRYPDGSRP